MADERVHLQCTDNCIHKPVCNLIGKMEQTKVIMQDDRFRAFIECSEYIPMLDDKIPFLEEVPDEPEDSEME